MSDTPPSTLTGAPVEELERIKVDDEIRYDLIQESFDLLLHLVDERLTSIELAMRTGAEPKEVEHRLQRLQKRGLVLRGSEGEDAGRWRAAGRHVFQQRQEGLMDSLTRYVLPAVGRGLAAQSSDEAYIVETQIELLPTQVKVLRSGALQKIIDGLLELSDRNDDGPRRRCSVALTGCGCEASDEALAIGARMLSRIQRAARLRARSATRDQAMLLQVDMRLSANTRQRVRDFLDESSRSLTEQFGAAEQHPFAVTALYVMYHQEGSTSSA